MITKLFRWLRPKPIEERKSVSQEWQKMRGSKWKDIVTGEKYTLAVSNYSLSLINKYTHKIKILTPNELMDGYIKVTSEEFKGDK